MFIVCDLCILPHPRSNSAAVVSLWSQETWGWQGATANSLRGGAGIVYGQQFWRHCLYRWVYWSMWCLWRMGMFGSIPMLSWPQPTCNMLHFLITYKVNNEISYTLILAFYVIEAKFIMVESKNHVGRVSCPFLISFIGSLVMGYSKRKLICYSKSIKFTKLNRSCK